jgi:hypothetical protein
MRLGRGVRGAPRSNPVDRAMGAESMPFAAEAARREVFGPLGARRWSKPPPGVTASFARHRSCGSRHRPVRPLVLGPLTRTSRSCQPSGRTAVVVLTPCT